MSAKDLENRYQLIQPDTISLENHYYPRVLNASLHPMVSMFMNLPRKGVIKRYCHLHPETNKEKLEQILNYQPSYFRWAGADLFCCSTPDARRQMVVVEVNSCPSGQKSMPSADDSGSTFDSQYHKLMHDTFRSVLDEQVKEQKVQGELAVVYDKNHMEASGYAYTLSDEYHEPVHFVKFFKHDQEPLVRFDDDAVMEINVPNRGWVKIRACFRYVTDAPWNRFPVRTRTVILNPIIACLAGGRNKLVAAKAYEFYNAELKQSGLTIRTPETIYDVSLAEIPLYVKSMQWHACIKVPYSNAGQGVYTITSKEELDAFMKLDHKYDLFIVQALVGNSKWSSTVRGEKLYHMGTLPDRRNNTYVMDVRLMIAAQPNGGYKPLACYARRAAVPLVEDVKDITDSWNMLGTNLSGKAADGSWTTDTNRLLLMDRKDFNRLGISIDDLIDGYVQTVLASIAIDKMCKKLFTDEKFNIDLFGSLNKDEHLLEEISKVNPK